MAKALVVIDVQQGMFADPRFQPHDGEAVVERIAGLIARARASATPVLYVQHDGEPGSPLNRGQPGFAFHDRLTPRRSDLVTVKRHSSAFHGTDFDAELKARGVDHLIVTGMQSEYCVDSAIRGAVERGYQVTLVADAHSTGDTRLAKARDIIAIQNDTMAGDFADVVPAAAVEF